MIKYALHCDKGHAFESWFPSSSAYDNQAKRGLVTCLYCGSSKVEKAIMAPSLKRTDKVRVAPAPIETPAAATLPDAPAPESKTPVAMMSGEERELRQKLKEVRDHLTRSADYVGSKFSEEARKMHYGETNPRSIYGEASLEEAKELADEGIAFHPLPVLPDDQN